MAIADEALDVDLDPLDGRIDVARRAAGAALLAEHMPRLERHAQLDGDARGGEVAEQREAEIAVRREPGELERIAGVVELADDVLEVLPDEVRQHEAVVQLGAPARQPRRLVRRRPEARDQRAHQQLLDQAHARVRRHLEGAHLEQAEAAGRAVGRIELVDAELGAVGVAGDVDQEIAQQSIDQPRRRLPGLDLGDASELGERDLDLVDRVVPRLVDARRLARRADEHAGEQVAQRRMVVPVADHAGEQVGPAQERRVARRRAAEDEVVAAAGAGVAAVEHELLGRQARLARGARRDASSARPARSTPTPG